MRSLLLAASPLTPEVTLRPEEGTLTMRGECYPENATAFFSPILGALEAWFRAAPLRAFVARFELRYVNSASTKGLRRLFGLLHAMAEHGIAVTVTWEHDRDDDAAADLGAELADRLPLLGFEVVATGGPSAAPGAARSPADGAPAMALG